MNSSNDSDIFQTKLTEYAEKLTQTFPEYAREIAAYMQLPLTQRKELFQLQLLPTCSPARDASQCPPLLLPGVPLTPEVWSTLSDKTKEAVQEYLTVLSFCLLMDSNPLEADLSGNGWTSEWAEKMMEDMKSKMKGIDFAGLSEKFAKFFASAADVSGGSAGPRIPEKFLKGQIARLAEEIVKEFRLEDFGLDPAAVEAAGNDPQKGLSLVLEVFTKNPQAFQKTIQKLTKKLQQKIQSGALRPKELVAEAEELMKTFSENPQFVEMMEGFRQAFSFGAGDDDERNAAPGTSARLSLVRARLQKKLEQKKAGAGRGGKK
jgi:hypothetical protein